MYGRATREVVLMRVTETIATRSTCSRLQVGCIIARDGRILSTGYNGAPAGMAHCDHPLDGPETACKLSVHAEANAIAYAARHGVALNGSELYTTHTPCLACAQIIINAGIVKAYALAKYRDQSGLELLVAAGVEVKIFPHGV